MNTKLYLGLDVHKNSIVVATALADGSEPQSHGKWGGSNLSAERGLLRIRKKFGVKKDEISIVYEAGPTGFVLARRLLQLGYHCIIVGPSEVPEKSGKRVKTDKRDARKLARLHRAGELAAIHIPEARDEAVRDLCRARTDAMQALSRAKQQLGMFMLRNGYRYDGKTNWTQAHMNYLRRTRMQHVAQQLVLEEYILEVDSGVERVARIEKQMKELLPEWERENYVRALMAFKGFKEVAAMTVISELGDISRFKHPRQLMGYLGMVPEESSSGEKRRQGGITKTGNGHARWMLIECASHYNHAPRVSPQLSARQAGQSREVRRIAWRAQNRLNYRFRCLAARQLHRNKIVVAIARELSGFIWELYHQVTTEQNAKKAN
ncbi:MAG: IS110 family transposase [Verrucomicrobiales bacterium]|nr:IS110 family transposase [Verrucomicrobiales bacterium]